jgi:hypothetical protein
MGTSRTSLTTGGRKAGDVDDRTPSLAFKVGFLLSRFVTGQTRGLCRRVFFHAAAQA